MIARDGGSPPESAVQRVIVFIRRNLNAPQFQDINLYQSTIPFNSGARVISSDILATDDDTFVSIPINVFQPITRRQILDCSKLKEFADDNFKFDKNGRKLSKQVENAVGKGEIARNEQFLLFPQNFSKGLFPRGVKRCHCVGMG